MKKSESCSCACGRIATSSVTHKNTNKIQNVLIRRPPICFIFPGLVMIICNQGDWCILNWSTFTLTSQCHYLGQKKTGLIMLLVNYYICQHIISLCLFYIEAKRKLLIKYFQYKWETVCFWHHMTIWHMNFGQFWDNQVGKYSTLFLETVCFGLQGAWRRRYIFMPTR